MLTGPVDNRRHRHVAASLLCALDPDSRLTVHADGQPHSGQAVLVAPDVAQSLRSCSRTLVLHLDPDNPLWRALAGNHPAPCQLLPWQATDIARLAALDDCDSALSARRLLAAMPGFERPPPALPERVARLAAWLRSTPDTVDLKQAAQQLAVSPARLSRQFRDTLGVTPKRFQLHLKLQRAMQFWQPGMNAVDIANAAGFYDQPHLIRTSRQMFDALPSAVLDNPQLKIYRMH